MRLKYRMCLLWRPTCSSDAWTGNTRQNHNRIGHAQVNTVGENIIATIKMRNYFCYPLKMVIFTILRQQYWTFLQWSTFSYRSSNFAIAKVVVLISLLQFLYEFCRFTLPTMRSFTLLKALAKSNSNLFAIAFKSEKERQLSLSRQFENR